MEETGEWIIKENDGNPEVISEVHSKINRAKSTINEVTVKLNDRRRRLETALTEKQRVFDTLDDFDKRVLKLDKSLTRAKPVSAEFIVIKEQRASHEVSHCPLFVVCAVYTLCAFLFHFHMKTMLKNYPRKAVGCWPNCAS